MQKTNTSTNRTILQSGRNYGIDLLRLLAMYMIVIRHILGQGAVLNATAGMKHHAIWLLETAAFCAVDCYAIISGFVSYREEEKPYKYSKFFGFWLQVAFYNFGITLLAFLLKPEGMEWKRVVKALLPVTTGAYWYVSAYAGLFFIIPWLNKLIRSCNQKEATRMAAVILTVFVGYVTFANYIDNSFMLEQGYSFAWLSILYVVGAWLKKCDIPNLIKNKYLLWGCVVCILFSWLMHEFVTEIFVNYTSFTIVFVAIALVSLFSKMQFGTGAAKWIACFAPAAFGVYLIHVQPVIWERYMVSSFIWIIDYPAWEILLMVLGFGFAIFAVCLLIEKLRLLLFRVLGINRFAKAVEEKLDRVNESVFEKITSKM